MNPIDYDRLSIPEATALQQELRQRIDLRPLEQPVHIIGGADISFNRFGTLFFGGIVLLSFPSLEPVACSLAKKETHFPYVPGYLAFREIPCLLQAWKQLPVKPDVLVVDGHGIAHPRRMGIAAHLGVVIDYPTIGCAKKILYGKYEEPGPQKGDKTAIKGGDESIGYALRTKERSKVVFVSPGHKITLEESLTLVSRATRKYRLPEPTRMAHEVVNAFRRGDLQEGFHPLNTNREQPLF